MSGPGVIVVREAERPEPEGEPVRVHCVPCAVEGGGGADVEGRFEPTVRSKGEGVYSATFRGRPLNGVQLTLPSGYTGAVLAESKQTEDPAPSQDREFEVKGHFSSMKYWQLDAPPTTDDKLCQALQWVPVSEQLHASLPVDVDVEDKP